MRRFELVDGASSKFWEITLDGVDLAVRFGRIGTQGQAKARTFGSEAEARKEHDKLVKEKTGKGYAEVGGESIPSEAVPMTVEVATEVVTEMAAGGAAASVLDEPCGGFQWTDEWRSALPTVRGIHVPALPDVQAMVEEPIELPTDFGAYAVEMKELNAHTGGSWSYWGAVRGKEMISRQALVDGDMAFWTDLCVQLAVARIDVPEGQHRGRTGYPYRYGLQWAAEVGVHLRGLPFMADLVLSLARQWHGSTFFARLADSMLPPLRAAIAHADDEAHDALVAALEPAGATPLDRLLRAHLCPHREDWALASLADGFEDSRFLLADCVFPPEAALQYLAGQAAYLSIVQSALLLQIHLHGERAFPLLADMLRRAWDFRENRIALAAFVVRMQVPQLPALLASLMSRKEVRAELGRLSERYPAATLKAVIEHAHAAGSRDAEGWAVRLALGLPSALAQALAALAPDSRQRFEMLLAVMQVSEAPAEALPAVLRDPPWLHKARAKPLPTVQLAPPAQLGRLTWTEAVRARHADCELGDWRPDDAQGLSDEAIALRELGIGPRAQDRLAAGLALQSDDLEVDASVSRYAMVEHVLVLTPAMGLAVWNGYPAQRWCTYGASAAACAVLARFGDAALPGFARFLAAHPEANLGLAKVADSPLIAPLVLQALRQRKKLRAQAAAWLRRYPATALDVALAQAFGTGPKVDRDDAQYGLRWFVANGFEAEARAAAAARGEAMVQALQALVDADPLLVLPARVPRLPSFFIAPALSRPMLRDGRGALGPSAIEHLGTMLAISELDAPYAGLAIVRDLCTPESLAAFAWSLYEAWWAEGAPSKEGWAFRALGLLGNDDTARRLTPLIRAWPSEGQHQRAVTGLDLLAAIGSDVALMHLHGIATKAKNKPLQARAQEKIAAVAEARGFTPAELADRLVPDLGLEDDGTLRLDFGPRAFTVAFDETLKPFVRDAQGARLKDLPKPLKSDDAALAAAATERFKQLKKDAKAVAGLQVLRLEMAMVERRRWSAAEFGLFFIEHPLMRHLAARLVWGVYGEDGALIAAFRVAEDFTLADADDGGYQLPASASVGIAHVLELSPALRAAFGQLFADYEVLQPFRQLGRETYVLTEAERQATQITRYADKTVATGSVLGLANRGWERVRDGGWLGWFSRPVGDGLEAQIELDPGTHIADLDGEPAQRIPSITLREAGTWDAAGLVRFDQLDPIAASELLRDADLLAPIQE